MRYVLPSVASSGLRAPRYRSPTRREAQPLPATTQPAQRSPATRRKSAPTPIAKLPTRCAARESPSWRRLGTARAADVNQTDGRCSAPRSGVIVLCQRKPGIDDGVRIQRNTLYVLLDKPLRELRIIRGTLPADTGVLAGLSARGNGHRQHCFDRIVAFVESRRDGASGIAVDRQRHLSHVVGADRETVEKLQAAIGENRVGRDLAHHDQPQSIVAALEAILLEDGGDLRGFGMRAHKR